MPGCSISPPCLRVRLVLGIVLAAVLLQFPADLIIRHVSVPWGILFNEVLVFLALPIAAAEFAGYPILAILPAARSTERRLLLSICLTVGSAILLAYLRDTTAHIVPIPEFILRHQIQPLEVHDWNDFYLKLLLVGAFTPLSEEIFFRGILQRTIARRWGRWRSILLSAILFALFHSTSFMPHLYLLMGLLFAWIFDVTGSLRPVILCHVINNAWTLTNQVHGLHFPLAQPMGTADVLLLTTGGVLVITSIRLLERRSRSRTESPLDFSGVR